MIDRHLVFKIHCLTDEGRSIRSMARDVGLSRDSMVKYLKNLLLEKVGLSRGSKKKPLP